MAKVKKAKKAPEVKKAEKAAKASRKDRITKRGGGGGGRQLLKAERALSKLELAASRHLKEVTKLVFAGQSSPGDAAETEDRLANDKNLKLVSLYHCYGFTFHYGEPIFSEFIEKEHIKVDSGSFMRMQKFVADILTICHTMRKKYASAGNDTDKKLAFFKRVASRHTATLNPVNAKLLMVLVDTYCKARREFLLQKDDESDKPRQKPNHESDDVNFTQNNYRKIAYGAQRQLWSSVDTWIDWVDLCERDVDIIDHELFEKMTLDDTDLEEL
ncbi:hypothetical protein GGR53DRAFT_117637 [Hypoxylon sp. FL1150]|nr:hypothetical protein GGR53DRAFT_117637 [Hypoxylon sp. FL1150]